MKTLTNNQAQEHHTTNGRSFAILAQFPNTPEGIKKSNAYLFANPGVGVLSIENERVILTALADKGVPVVDQTI